VALPDTRSEEQKAADAAAAEAAAAAAAADAAAKAKKGGKGAAAATEPENAAVGGTSLTAPMFNKSLMAEVRLTCAHMLSELSLSDARCTAPHAPAIAALALQAQELLKTVQNSVSERAAVASTSSDPTWLSQYGRVSLLTARLLVQQRKYRSARAMATALLQVFSQATLTLPSSLEAAAAAAAAESTSGSASGSPSNSGSASSSQKPLQAECKLFLTEFWLQTRDLIVELAERQARFEDAIKGASVQATEAAAVCCGFWLRAALLRRARVQHKLGKLTSSLSDVDAALGLYATSGTSDVQQVELVVLKAGLIREQSLFRPQEEAVDALATCVALLRGAQSLAEDLASRAGFLGTDANVTFTRGQSRVLKYHLMAPVLHSLTTIHPNEPDLTVPPKVSKDQLLSARGLPAPVGSPSKLRGDAEGGTGAGTAGDSEGDGAVGFREGGAWGPRPGPVDTNETELTPSEFSNVHLPELRCLVVLSASQVTLLDDVRLSGACTLFDPREREGTELAGTQAVLDPVLALREQSARGEDALKALRHVSAAPSVARCVLLLSVGKSRYATAKSGTLYYPYLPYLIVYDYLLLSA